MEVLMSFSILFVFHSVPPCSALCVEYVTCASETQEITERETRCSVLSLLKRERALEAGGDVEHRQGLMPPLLYQSVHCARNWHSFYLEDSAVVPGIKKVLRAAYSIYTKTVRSSSGNLIICSLWRAQLTRRRVCSGTDGKVLQW